MKTGKEVVASTEEKVRANILKASLFSIIKGMPIPEVPTFYTDSNKLGMAGLKSDKIIKTIQCKQGSGGARL